MKLDISNSGLAILVKAFDADRSGNRVTPSEAREIAVCLLDAYDSGQTFKAPDVEIIPHGSDVVITLNTPENEYFTPREAYRMALRLLRAANLVDESMGRNSR
jgi:hypothetical protein